MLERNALATLTRLVLAHKRLVTGFWLLVTVAAVAAIGPAGDALSREFPLPGREGYETNREIAARYGNGGDVFPLVPVVTLPSGTTVDSPGVRAELDAAVARVQAALPGARLASYASTGDRAFVSEDGRTTFALVYIPERPGLEPGQLEATRAQEAVDGVTVGGAPVQRDRASMRCAPRPRARRRTRASPSSPRCWWRGSAPCSCSPSCSRRSWRSCPC